MISEYKRKTKIFIWLAYGFMFVSGIFTIILEESEGGDWTESQYSDLIMIPFIIGYILMIIGCNFWAQGKGYAKTRGVLIGFFLHFFAPIVMAFHPDKTIPVKDPTLNITEIPVNKMEINKIPRQRSTPKKPVLKKVSTSKKGDCPRCAESMKWRSGLLSIKPSDFAGVCNRSRIGFCIEHDPGGYCPKCGSLLDFGKRKEKSISEFEGGSDKCQKCEDSLLWWSRATIKAVYKNIQYLSEPKIKDKPSYFGGACQNCREGFCNQHAPNGVCPKCGSTLKIDIHHALK